ncbi:hypothetical protein [Intestinibacillus massiliensis]|uniref:hypothetical protein n=1 Tax=Intestinibacillus massiliensis TaxID=1871029 RepID=UPI001F18A72A|nr:hypothetical protein [Intestinibacillus massiliensis]
MSVDKFNSEGYYDPTAYEAMTTIEKEERALRAFRPIVYICSTYTREIYSANILEVEAGTNGFQGGDSGHGSRAYIRIEDMGGTDIRINPLGRDGEEGFELFPGGDCELEPMTTALKFITKALEDGAKEVHD